MQATEISKILPGIFQRTVSPASPLWAMLNVMELLHAPAEQALTQIDMICDPNRTPDQFVPFLARWVDLEKIFQRPPDDVFNSENTIPLSTGAGRLRQLIGAAAHLSQWRGTLYGLRRFLEIAVGETGFRLIENADRQGNPRAFHLIVIAPASVREHRALIERIVEVERPAYVTWEVAFEQVQLKSET